jgi:hypothetical protein
MARFLGPKTKLLFPTGDISIGHIAKVYDLARGHMDTGGTTLSLNINRKKSTSPPKLWGVEHITPQPMKIDFLPPELFKTGQITP